MNQERRWGTGFVDIEEKTLPSLKAQRVLQALEDLPLQSSLLDFGCGEGKLLNTIEKYRPGFNLYGTDIQTPLDTNLQFQFSLIQNEHIPFHSQTFDAIFSIDVLEHVPNLDKTLQHFVQMLNPQGKLILFVPMEGEAFSSYAFFRRILGKDLYLKTKDHKNSFQKKAFLNHLSQYFKIEKVSYSYHIFGTLFDSTFFALTILKSMEKWFWTSNSIYHVKNKKKGFLNRLMEWTNALCYWESTYLRNVARFSSGIHVVLTQKKKSI